MDIWAMDARATDRPHDTGQSCLLKEQKLARCTALHRRPSLKKAAQQKTSRSHRLFSFFWPHAFARERGKSAGLWSGGIPGQR